MSASKGTGGTEAATVSAALGSDVMDAVAEADVGNRARKGAFWSALQILVRNGISIGSTAVLARLVSPDDYGLIGMVGTLTALLLVFSDMGLSWATVQRRNLTEAQVSNLFWLNATAGLILWGVCIFLAPWLVGFYGRPELNDITLMLGASFLLGGVAAQPMALLTRKMQFRQTTLIEIGSMMVSTVTGITLALLGWAYWALVWQLLAGQAARALLALTIARPPLQWPTWGVGTSSLVRFGGLMAVNSLLIYMARTLDTVLVGKFWGTEDLGYYSRAYFLMLLPSMLATGVLANLMVPSLSAFQHDVNRFGSAYRRAIRMVAFIGCPMAVGLALTAPEAVRLIYGEKWGAVVPLLMWLSIAGITQPIYNTTGWLFTAAGKAKLYLVLTGCNAVLLTFTFFVTVHYGTVAVAKGYGLVMGVLLLWPAMYLAHYAAGLKLTDTLRVLFPVFLALALMAAAVYVVGQLCELLNVFWLWTFAIKVAVGALSYVIASAVLLRQFLIDDVFSMLPSEYGKRASKWLTFRVN